MATLAIALKDLILDPERPVDLAALPEADAIAQIKKSLGFLAPSLQVTIQDGIATVTLPDENAQDQPVWPEKGRNGSKNEAANRAE